MLRPNYTEAILKAGRPVRKSLQIIRGDDGLFGPRSQQWIWEEMCIFCYILKVEPEIFSYRFEMVCQALKRVLFEYKVSKPLQMNAWNYLNQYKMSGSRIHLELEYQCGALDMYLEMPNRHLNIYAGGPHRSGLQIEISGLFVYG